MYRLPHEMEPMLPAAGRAQLERLAAELVRRAATLEAALHPVTRDALAGLLRQMNSYYSNLIEGHETRPRDIERALRDAWARDPTRRALQIESRAHVEVQAELESRLDAGDATDPIELLRWIHGAFYTRLPSELRRVTSAHGEVAEVEPGVFRARDVEVGRHVAPAHDAIPPFLRRFAEAYRPDRLAPLEAVIAVAASHHRLAWIHPFLDGNGRVARLFSHAQLWRAGVQARLWNVSRGLARRRSEYVGRLADADEPRRGDLDGRGNLTDAGLSEFCAFFLEVAIDQVAFMTTLIDVDGILARIHEHARHLSARRIVHPASGRVLAHVFLTGRSARGELAGVAQVSPRTGQEITRGLLAHGLLRADSPKGPVRFAFPVSAVEAYLPLLFPAGAAR